MAVRGVALLVCLVVGLVVGAVGETARTLDGDLPANYQTLDAASKRDIVWSRLVQDTTSETWPSSLAIMKMLFWDMKQVFENATDVRPFSPRVAHVVGAYAKARFVPVEGTPYSGLYSSGGLALLRLSTAVEPSVSGNSGSIVPAVAVKLFKNGLPSANYAAMYTFGPTPGINLFNFSLCTHGPRKGANFALKVLAMAFDRISKVSSSCGGTMQVATHTADGTPVEKDQVNVPFALILQPNPQLRSLLDGYVGTELMRAISERVSDSMVNQVGYKVLAVTGPNFPGKDEIIHIGDFVLESEITTSLWGDRYLFFQQQKFDVELGWNHDWKQKVDDDFLDDEGLPYKYVNYLPEWN